MRMRDPLQGRSHRRSKDDEPVLGYSGGCREANQENERKVTTL